MVNNLEKKSPVLFIIGLLCLLSPESRAQDEVHMKVRSEGLRRIVLAVSPFQPSRQTDLGDQLRRIIINDLELSGFFQIVDLSDSENKDLLNLRSISRPGNWDLNAAVLLENNFELRGGTISLNSRLQELPTYQQIFEKDFNSSLRTIRQLGHRVADEVTYYLTGDPGIANTKIAFVTVGKTAKEIAVADYDGYGVQPITSNGSLNLSPCWAPDGKFIAFTSYLRGNPDLYVLRLSDGRTVNASKQNVLHSAPAWSPDGKKIAMTLSKNGNSDIYTMEVKGERIRRLTNNPSIDSSPSWSPNGRGIVFTSGRSGTPQIYIMDSDGGSVRRLTFEGSYNASPVWSPRGDLIAFVSRESGRFQIYTIDVNGENLYPVTDSPGNHENPSWSPNGMWLTFASNGEGKWDIYVVHWDGTELRRLTHNGGNVSPSWSPQLKHKE